jgi:rRNA maturation protein Nop10
MQCKICRKIKAIKAYTFATTCFPLSKQNQILSHLHCPLAPLKPMRVARVAVRSLYRSMIQMLQTKLNASAKQGRYTLRMSCTQSEKAFKAPSPHTLATDLDS